MRETKRENKRMLTLVLFILLASMFVDGRIAYAAGFPAKNEQAASDLDGNMWKEDQITYINPLYRDVITEEDLVSPEEQSAPEFSNESISVSEDGTSISQKNAVLNASTQYVSETEAVNMLREQMKERKTSMEIPIVADHDYYPEMADKIMKEAMCHTGDPTEGDYLKWQYAGWHCNVSYTYGGSLYYMIFTYTMTYYTTVEQEAELDQAIDAVIKELGLKDPEKKRYDKVKAIYDYLCENVTYDNANLNDADYKLKYTAYAALMNKTAVCQGYALLFYRLALESGIDARLIAGTGYTGSGGGAHGWNIVRLGGKYYDLDATWDTSYYGHGKYAYFLKCESEFGQDHSRSEDYTTGDFNDAYPMGETDYDPNKEPEVDWSLSSDGVLTVDCYDEMPDYSDATKQPWYSERDSIKKVTIGDEMISIGDHAFEGCTALTEVSFGKNVKRIGANAFNGCSNLKQVSTGNSVVSIGTNAFAFSGIEEIAISDNVEQIADRAFGDCTELIRVTDGKGNYYYIKDLQKRFSNLSKAFEGTTWVENRGLWEDKAVSWTLNQEGTLTIRGEGDMSDYKAIGAPWYSKRKKIKKVVLEGNITGIGGYAFEKCSALTEVTIPDTVTYIGKHAFDQCTLLSNVLLPNSVVKLDDYAYTDSGLEHIVHKDGTQYRKRELDQICQDVFISLADTPWLTGYKSHTHIQDEPVNENIGEATCVDKGYYDVIIYCSVYGEELSRERHEIPATGNHTAGKPKEENRVEATCVDTGSYEEVVYCDVCEEELSRERREIPATGNHTAGSVKEENRVEAVGEIPGSYEEVVYCVVCGEELSRMKKEIPVKNIPDVAPEKDTILSPNAVSGGIYKVTEQGTAVAYMAPNDKKQSTVKIPATVTIDHITYKVTAVSDNAFKNNKSVKKVTIGSNVTTIGKNAFSGCSKLQTVTIGKKVTTIGEKAFYKNTSLKKIVIPANVKKIEAKAFYGSKKLQTVTIKTSKLTAKKVGSQAFKGINKKASVKVPKKQKKAYTAWLRKRGIAKTAKIK